LPPPSSSSGLKEKRSAAAQSSGWRGSSAPATSTPMNQNISLSDRRVARAAGDCHRLPRGRARARRTEARRSDRASSSAA
jgi:hypothetical protein